MSGNYLDDHDDLDDETEFNPSDDSESEDELSEDDEEEDEHFAVLSGSLSLNDEGRLVYSGTWAMNTAAASTTTTDSADGNNDATSGKTGSDVLNENSEEKKRKKKDKFKLKSKQILETGTKRTFDLCDPLMAVTKNKRHNHRTMLFDGFFFSNDSKGGNSKVNHHHRVRERDVEITFFPKEDSPQQQQQHQEDECEDEGAIKNGNRNASINSFQVRGRGMNEYGVFTLDGTYEVQLRPQPADVQQEKVSNTLICNKHYDSQEKGSATRKRKSSKRKYSYDSQDHHNNSDIDENDDDLYEPDEGTDYNEVIALNEEAEMSVEELCRRYHSGGAAGESATSDSKISPPSKRTRTEEDVSEDDECGF